MRSQIETYLSEMSSKTMSTADLQEWTRHTLGNEYVSSGGYIVFAQTLCQLCDEGLLSPVKASGFNERKPKLYNRYRKVSEVLDLESQRKLNTFDPRIDTSKYYAHPTYYAQDLHALVALDQFYKDSSQVTTLTFPYALNERSFQIFRDEKFLASPEGHAFLQRINLNEDKLNTYRTPEPFFYVDYRQSWRRDTEPISVLIIENKDTFFTLKKCWMENTPSLAGIPFQLLVYGEGRKITGSFSFIDEISGLSQQSVQCYYFGDLDREGIDIYGTLAASFPEAKILPMITLYEKLIELYGGQAPAVRDKKQRLRAEYLTLFLRFFPREVAEQIVELLENGKYIPQEGLSYAFFNKAEGNDGLGR